MPSPFPGMDPFIEGRSWQNFHDRLLTSISDCLLPSVKPRYALIVEQRVYLEHDVEPRNDFRPDLVVVDDPMLLPNPRRSAAATADAPVMVTLPQPEEAIERYLAIRDMESNDVVTVIEILSPANKRHNSDGRDAYLKKREALLRSATHLVEIDLLRSGERMPIDGPLPPSDYVVVVSRRGARPGAAAWPIDLRGSLPTIPIPLSAGDSDATLDLQRAFTDTYDRAGFDYTLKYAAPVKPPLSPEDEAWARAILAERPQPSA